MGKTKKLALHSPENPRRFAASDSGGGETIAGTRYQYFGTPLVELLKLENTEVPHLVVKACLYIYEHGQYNMNVVVCLIVCVCVCVCVYWDVGATVDF